MFDYYYSKTTRGFYPPDFRGVMPGDVMQITDAEWRALLDGAAAEGKEIVPDAGGRPVLAVPPPPDQELFSDLTPRQLCMALTRAGLRAQVEAAVATGDQDLKDWWEKSLSFERNHPQVVLMIQALGKTPADADAVWRLGAML